MLEKDCSFLIWKVRRVFSTKYNKWTSSLVSRVNQWIWRMFFFLAILCHYNRYMKIYLLNLMYMPWCIWISYNISWWNYYIFFWNYTEFGLSSTLFLSRICISSWFYFQPKSVFLSSQISFFSLLRIDCEKYAFFFKNKCITIVLILFSTIVLIIALIAIGFSFKYVLTCY